MDKEQDRREAEVAKPLGMLVGEEARRLLSDAQLEPDPALVAEGWERRFIADGQRAEEMMSLYRRLGYEVRAVPVKAEEFGDDCYDCQLLGILKFATIYTRKSANSQLEEQSQRNTE